jgi:hypothetical protein
MTKRYERKIVCRALFFQDHMFLHGLVKTSGNVCVQVHLYTVQKSVGIAGISRYGVGSCENLGKMKLVERETYVSQVFPVVFCQTISPYV